MAYSIVQFASGHSNSSVASIAATLGANITAGNAVAVFVHEQSATRANRGSVADAAAGSYTRPGSAIANDTVNAWGLDTFYKLNHPGGVATVTFTPTASSTCGIVVAEISGIDASSGFDIEQRNYQASPGTSTDGVTTGSKSNNAQPGVLIACALNSAGAATPAVGTGYTNITSMWSVFGTTSGRLERKSISNVASQAATFTTSSNTGHISAFMVFLETIAGGGISIPLVAAYNEMMSES